MKHSNIARKTLLLTLSTLVILCNEQVISNYVFLKGNIQTDFRASLVQQDVSPLSRQVIIFCSLESKCDPIFLINALKTDIDQDYELAIPVEESVRYAQKYLLVDRDLMRSKFWLDYSLVADSEDSNRDLTYLMGVYYTLLKEWGEAENYYELATKREYGFFGKSDAYFRLGHLNTLYNQNTRKDGFYYYNHAIEENDFSSNRLQAEAYRFRALQLMERQEFAKALKDLEVSIGLFPNNYFAYVALGKTHYFLGDKLSADNWFYKAIAFDDNKESAFVEYAKLLSFSSNQQQLCDLLFSVNDESIMVSVSNVIGVNKQQGCLDER